MAACNTSRIAFGANDEIARYKRSTTNRPVFFTKAQSGGRAAKVRVVRLIKHSRVRPSPNINYHYYFYRLLRRRYRYDYKNINFTRPVMYSFGREK